MRKDPTEFRERFKRWKAGEKVYDAGTPTILEYDGGKTPEDRPKTHWLTRLPESIVDATLYGADVLGVPSHITNALRDINIWRANQPVIVADALYNMLSGKKDNILDAYREADINPSELAKHFEVFPIENTESNYTGDELAAQYELRLHSGGKPGAITSDGYKWANSGRYAGDIDASNFMSPFKVNEWSLGQTSGIKGEDGNNYTSDIFAYDTKDTFGNYLPRILKGTASPVMFLRTLLGTFGSKGYSDNSNSATAIRTKINTKVLQKAYLKKYGTTERKQFSHDYNFGKSPKIIHYI